MNKDEQRIRIAEAWGWKLLEEGHPATAKPDRWLLNEKEVRDKPPDYLSDLNAACEFARRLGSLGWRCIANMGLGGTWECFFTKDIERVLLMPEAGDHYGAGDTLAAAICEAGLRALGKWTE